MTKKKVNYVPRGEIHRQRISELLASGPRSTEEISVALKLSRVSVSNYIVMLRNEKAIHVSDNRSKGSGRPAPVYALGNLPDHVYKIRKYKRPPPKAVRFTGEERRQQVLQHLRKGMSSSELAQKMSLSKQAARRYIRTLIQQKKVSILRHDSPVGAGCHIAIFIYGNREPAVRVKKSRRQLYREKMADPVRAERVMELRSIRRMLILATKKKQSIFSPLGL